MYKNEGNLATESNFNTEIDFANEQALEMICSANPILIDVQRAIDVVPGMTKNTILTSGPPTKWEDYTGGQRSAIIGGVIHEGLADSPTSAAAAIRSGEVLVLPCQDFDCVGSLAGIHTASMPVLVVEDEQSGSRAYCSLFEGKAPSRLNYGVYNNEVRENLIFLEQTIGPLLGEAVRLSGGIELRPIIRRALNMGDELHSRNTAATLLFTRELFPYLLAVDRSGENKKIIDEFLDYILSGDYFFLRASMAAAKASMARVKNIAKSTIVSTMVFSCKEFAIQVAGLGDKWFRGPLPHMESCHLFEGFSKSDIEFMGGESIILETYGLGGFSQAAAFPLQAYQGGTPESMIEKNLRMYDISASEHTYYKIPFLEFRGTPIGIDIRKVVESEITPTLDIGVAGKGGGQIGAGSFSAPIEPFQKALQAFQDNFL
ncbi:DUF1116 domain-containing protein [Sporosarcina sp. FSL W7-1349]|uniref:DUF1116 domain-containing protein n=1 Tax=Sporosarcina sp. FSL W7-1349 TaxID=2921561 RepID=UPI0030FBBA47